MLSHFHGVLFWLTVVWQSAVMLFLAETLKNNTDLCPLQTNAKVLQREAL